MFRKQEEPRSSILKLFTQLHLVIPRAACPREMPRGKSRGSKGTAGDLPVSPKKTATALVQVLLSAKSKTQANGPIIDAHGPGRWLSQHLDMF